MFYCYCRAYIVFLIPTKIYDLPTTGNGDIDEIFLIVSVGQRDFI